MQEIALADEVGRNRVHDRAAALRTRARESSTRALER
jgi:hypothetical protein